MILNGNFEAIHYCGNANDGFENITAETVIYDIPAAGITSTDAKTFGPFYGADITNFVLGEHVEFIHSQLLRGNEFTNCYVYPVDAGGDIWSRLLRKRIFQQQSICMCITIVISGFTLIIR